VQIDCAEPFRIRSAITAGVWRQCRLLSFLVSSSICVASSSGNTTTQLPVVTKAIDIRKMPASEAKRGYPVRLKGVITYYDPEEPDLFVQDATMGVWVNLEIVKPNVPLRAGDLVEVEGLTEVPDFAPQVGNPHFKVLGRAPLPRARPVSFGRVASTQEDSQRVEVEGVVHRVSKKGNRLYLDVAIEEGLGDEEPVADPFRRRVRAQGREVVGEHEGIS